MKNLIAFFFSFFVMPIKNIADSWRSKEKEKRNGLPFLGRGLGDEQRWIRVSCTSDWDVQSLFTREFCSETWVNVATWLFCYSILLTVEIRYWRTIEMQENANSRLGFLQSLCSSCAFQGSIKQTKHSCIKLMCWLRHFKVLLLCNKRICEENERH